MTAVATGSAHPPHLPRFVGGRSACGCRSGATVPARVFHRCRFDWNENAADVVAVDGGPTSGRFCCGRCAGCGPFGGFGRLGRRRRDGRAAAQRRRLDFVFARHFLDGRVGDLVVTGGQALGVVLVEAVTTPTDAVPALGVGRANFLFAVFHFVRETRPETCHQEDGGAAGAVLTQFVARHVLVETAQLVVYGQVSEGHHLAAPRSAAETGARRQVGQLSRGVQRPTAVHRQAPQSHRPQV